MVLTGITLMNLLITIAVLLILAGVAIGIAFNGEGLIEKSNNVVSGINRRTEEDKNMENLIHDEILAELKDSDYRKQ